MQSIESILLFNLHFLLIFFSISWQFHNVHFAFVKKFVIKSDHSNFFIFFSFSRFFTSPRIILLLDCSNRDVQYKLQKLVSSCISIWSMWPMGAIEKSVSLMLNLADFEFLRWCLMNSFDGCIDGCWRLKDYNFVYIVCLACQKTYQYITFNHCPSPVNSLKSFCALFTKRFYNNERTTNCMVQ